MSQNILRAIIALTGVNVVITGSTLYRSNQLLERNYEEAEARMDELEGTLRGHIGLIEESLERIEGTVCKESGWGKGMGSKTEEMYAQRGRDGKEKKK